MVKVCKNYCSSKKLVCLLALMIFACYFLNTVKNKIAMCQWFDFYSNIFAVKTLIFQHTYLKKK